jgi:uncharacterized membrane protein
MKYLAITGVVAGAVVVGLYFSDFGAVEVINTEPEVVTETIEVDALSRAIEQAQESRKSEVEAEATKAYNAAYERGMKEIELQVIKDFNIKLDARQIELEKETKQY